RNEKNLEDYYKQVEQTDSQLVKLKNLFPSNSQAFDSLTASIHYKFDIYDKLIELRYRELINTAMSKISDKVEDVEIYQNIDSTETSKPGFFKSLFSSKKKLRELERKALLLDSLNDLQAQKLSTIKQTVSEAKENEIRKVTQLSDGELLLLEQDRLLKERIQSQIVLLEGDIRHNNENKSLEVISNSQQQLKTVVIATITASVLILILSIIILADISRANRYKIQLEEARARSEQLARFKEEFLATMSHEIRTPLSALTGFINRLQKTNTTTEQQQYVNTINMAGQHLLNIVNDVLDLSRIETGKLNFKQDPFVIYKEVNDVVTLLSQKADEKNIALVLEASNIRNLTVSGDALRLRQVLINVIGNAIKFTEKGTVLVKVEKQEGELFKFEVTDTGIGIAEEKIAKLFDAYQQADNIERNYGGTGLGLAITKRLVELQKGTISMKSVPEKGTTVTVMLRFPLTPMNETKITEKEFVSLHGFRLLVAEDDLLNRQLITAMLKDGGAEVITAESGKQAIEKILLYNPDGVLMDIQMPELDGYNAASFIREHISAMLPLIGITANMMNDAKNECIAAGMNAVILKPFKLHELTEVLIPLIEKNREVQHKPLLSYSLDSLFRTSNGKSDFVIRMLKVFISSNQSLIEKSIHFAKESDFQQSAAAVHRMIPGFRQLDLDTFASILKNIEWLMLDGTEKNAATELLQQCAEQFEKLVAAIQSDIDRLEKEATT
ncbi:MAG TPA: ATP-binding protein, partial [Bacteroidia bacterium]|nr:ATP-binding protein [Bacteroidia bacterium]